VANCVDADMPALQENIDSLCARLPVPCLGVVPFLTELSPDLVANYFDETELQQLIQ
jgi:dethiobiotin synthetase